MSLVMTDGYTFRELVWDTDFFGLRCARIELNSTIEHSEFEQLLHKVRDYDLVYIANKNCNIQNAVQLARQTSAFVADTNVQFIKNVDNTVKHKEKPVCRDMYPYSQEIVDLADTVFAQSRFAADERLAQLGGGRMHGEWVKNAFDQRGRFFAESRMEGVLIGFTLFNIKNGVLTLELIGIDANYRGRGVGRRLWETLEAKAQLAGCREIHVGTQLHNLPAMNFYIRRGCAITETNQIYHLWNQSS